MAWEAWQLLDKDVVCNEEKLSGILKWMREQNPCPWIEDKEGRYYPFRAITRYQDVLAIEKDPERFTNMPISVMQLKTEEDLNIEMFGKRFAIDTLIQMDPPKHTVYRNLTQSWFNPGSIKKLTAQVQELAVSYVDRMEEMGELDFVKEISAWYPLEVIGLILGIPREDLDLPMKLTQELMSPEDPDTLKGRDRLPLLETVTELQAYFQKLTEDRQSKPRDDLATLIANAEIDGEEVPMDMKLAYYILIIVAGHDTTKFASSGGLYAMLKNPAELEKLRARPELIDLATEEMIRWSSPVRHFLRTAQEDCELSGVKIKKGERLMLLYGSASRDTSVIADADQFLIDRDPNRHLAFGHGIHMCLGQHLARLEMKVLFDEIFKRFSRIELAGEPSWLLSMFVGGIKQLPIRVFR